MQTNNRRTRLASMLVLASALVLTSSTSDAAPVEAEPDPAANMGDDDTYKLSVSNGSAKVGETGTITVTVKAAEGYKCNGEYPNKVKNLVATNGGRLAAESVAGRIDGKTLTFAIQVTPTKRGDSKVSGEARFSVCNATGCAMKKVAINAKVTGT